MRPSSLRHLPFLLAVTAFVAWVVLLRPAVLGGPTSYLTITGTSMLPGLDDGDFAVVRQADHYSTGDVVAFRIPTGRPGEGNLVIHRIVGGSATEGFVTQGDNKPAADPWHPTAHDVVGALWFAVPGGGRLLAWLRQPAVFAALAASLAVFLVVVSANGDLKHSRLRPTLSARARAPRQDGGTTLPDRPAGYQWTLAQGDGLGVVRMHPEALVVVSPASSVHAPGHGPRSGGIDPPTGVADGTDPLARYRWTIGPAQAEFRATIPLSQFGV
jgi:signal peptidase I